MRLRLERTTLHEVADLREMENRRRLDESRETLRQALETVRLSASQGVEDKDWCLELLNLARHMDEMLKEKDASSRTFGAFA